MLSRPFAPRVKVTIRPGLQSITVKRGQRLLLVNGDIRPHVLEGPDLRLERPGDVGVVRFRTPGIYVLRTQPGESLVPSTGDEAAAGATLRITVR